MLIFQGLPGHFAPASATRRLQIRGRAQGPSSGKLTWLALGDDHEDPSRGGEQAIALGRL